jgi:hypothetical protein
MNLASLVRARMMMSRKGNTGRESASLESTRHARLAIRQIARLLYDGGEGISAGARHWISEESARPYTADG